MKKYIVLAFLVMNPLFAYEIHMNFIAPSTEADNARLTKIAARIKQLASSEEFKEKALGFKNYSCMGESNFPDGVSTVEESLTFIDTTSIKIDISFFRANNSVVASTGESSISFNKNMFDVNSDASVANTLFHESLHALDFRHCNRNNIRLFPKIKRSIPYKFGDYIEEIY